MKYDKEVLDYATAEVAATLNIDEFDAEVMVMEILEKPDPHFERVFQEAWQPFRVLEPLSFPQWMEKHYWLSAESSGTSGQWLSHPYQLGIMHCLGNEGVRTVTWQKPARFGYTKMITGFIGYLLERKKRNVAIWQPTDSDAHEYVQDEIDPMFRDCSAVGAALLVEPGKKDPSNTNSRKACKNATLHINGGKSASNYRRITVDVAILDELDGFDYIIKGTDGKAEGTAISLSNIRTTNSVFKKSIRGSTPTVEGSSQIQAELEACEHVFERHVPCKHCNELQTLKWGGKDCDFGIKFDKDLKKPTYECEHCHGHMTWGDMLQQDKKSFWMSHELYINDETGKFHYIHDDKKAPTPEDVGFNCNCLISPFITWAETVKEFLAAAKRLALGENSAMMTWVNTRMGDCFEEHEFEKRDPNTFLDRREVYEAECPLQVTAITAAVDVHIDRFELQYTGWAMGEEAFVLKYVKYIGNMHQTPIRDEEGREIPGQQQTAWHVLRAMLNRTFRHESGQDIGVTIACIDSGYLTEQVYDFCRQDRTRFIPVKGSSEGPNHPIVAFPNKVSTKGVFLTIVGGDNCQDVLHMRYDITDNGPGKIHWPVNDDEFGLEYYTQMLAEVRVKVRKRGRSVLTWKCPPNTRNEPADLMKYNLAAIKIAQQYKYVVLSSPVLQYNPDDITADQHEPVDMSEVASRLNRPSG